MDVPVTVPPITRHWISFMLAFLLVTTAPKESVLEIHNQVMHSMGSIKHQVQKLCVENGREEIPGLMFTMACVKHLPSTNASNNLITGLPWEQEVK